MNNETLKIYKEVNDLSFYITTNCQMKCSYCNNNTLEKKSISEINLNENLKSFIEENNISVINTVSFHGGEPLLKITIMKTIMEIFDNTNVKVSEILIQTNGVAIETNNTLLKDFITTFNAKYKIRFSISYDFLFNYENRNETGLNGDNNPIIKRLNFLSGFNNVFIQLQMVLDLKDLILSDSLILSIKEMYFNKNIRFSSLIIIPLKFITKNNKRYNQNFLVYEKYTKNDFFKFYKFIEAINNLNIHLIIDGNNYLPTKNYFDNYKQIVLAPNGFIYPDYEFYEFDSVDNKYSIGNWLEKNIATSKPENEELFKDPICEVCPNSDFCSIKYIKVLHNLKPFNYDRCKYYMREISAIIVDQLSYSANKKNVHK
jgi:MoaA/NifB/PqqE/SkfB family radical SAM enzyme